MGNFIPCGSTSHHHHKPSFLDSQLALLVQQAEAKADSDLLAFNRILLQRALIRSGFSILEDVFRDAGGVVGGSITFAQARAALASHGIAMDGVAIFGETNLDGSPTAATGLTFREFALAVALGLVLGSIRLPGIAVEGGVLTARPSSASTSPRGTIRHSMTEDEALASGGDTGTAAAIAAEEAQALHAEATGAAPPASSRRNSHVSVSPMHAIAHAIDLIFQAFCHFDARRCGLIHRRDLEEGMCEVGGFVSPVGTGVDSRKHPAESFQVEGSSQARGDGMVHPAPRRHVHPTTLHFLAMNDRWKELDWDSDGVITFREFMWGFLGWLGMGDDAAGDE